MKTVEDTKEIETLFPKFVPDGDGAYPTDRVMDVAGDVEFCERGTIDGVPAAVFYVFDDENDDFSKCEDLSSLNWDEDHITRINISELDCTGEWQCVW